MQTYIKILFLFIFYYVLVKHSFIVHRMFFSMFLRYRAIFLIHFHFLIPIDSYLIYCVCFVFELCRIYTVYLGIAKPALLSMDNILEYLKLGFKLGILIYDKMNISILYTPLTKLKYSLQYTR